MPWHCSEVIRMIQQIILNNPDNITKLLNFDKSNEQLQHYVTVAIVCPHYFIDIPDNSPFESHFLPNEKIAPVCKAIKDIRGWNKNVVDRVIDSINRYDVPIRSSFTLLDSIFDPEINPNRVMMMSGWIFQKSKEIKEDVSPWKIHREHVY